MTLYKVIIFKILKLATFDWNHWILASSTGYLIERVITIEPLLGFLLLWLISEKGKKLSD